MGCLQHWDMSCINWFAVFCRSGLVFLYFLCWYVPIWISPLINFPRVVLSETNSWPWPAQVEELPEACLQTEIQWGNVGVGELAIKHFWKFFKGFERCAFFAPTNRSSMHFFEHFATSVDWPWMKQNWIHITFHHLPLAGRFRGYPVGPSSCRCKGDSP